MSKHIVVYGYDSGKVELFAAESYQQVLDEQLEPVAAKQVILSYHEAMLAWIIMGLLSRDLQIRQDYIDGDNVAYEVVS